MGEGEVGCSAGEVGWERGRGLLLLWGRWGERGGRWRVGKVEAAFAEGVDFLRSEDVGVDYIADLAGETGVHVLGYFVESVWC